MLDRPLLAGGGQFNYFEKVAIESARNGTVTRTPPPLLALAANRSLEIPLGESFIVLRPAKTTRRDEGKANNAVTRDYGNKPLYGGVRTVRRSYRA